MFQRAKINDKSQGRAYKLHNRVRIILDKNVVCTKELREVRRELFHTKWTGHYSTSFSYLPCKERNSKENDSTTFSSVIYIYIYIFQNLFLTRFFSLPYNKWDRDMWTQIFCSSIYLEIYFSLHGLDIFIFF